VLLKQLDSHLQLRKGGGGHKEGWWGGVACGQPPKAKGKLPSERMPIPKLVLSHAL
jgi:hypothetical protein